MRLAIFAVLAACSGGRSHESAPDAPVTPDAPDPPAMIDDDHDGLDDAFELRLARDYMPFVSLDPDDGCPLSGMVARVREHPDDATKIVIVYSHLFQEDCGLNGHVGDNEAFGIAIDPTVPPPAGILAIRTAAHQNTPCERVTQCTTCAGDSRTACDRADDAGTQWPVLYASRGKHGQYASAAQCPLIGTCFDKCTLARIRVRPPVVNAGEPSAPLTRDLTADGFITAANGWTEPALLGFDPWDFAANFGSAGNVAGDLTDPAFIPATCE